MRSARSPLLLFLLGVAFALWSPLAPVCGRIHIKWCETLPNSERCEEPEERFFYNVASRSCEPFTFFGCPGNLNSYRTIQLCRKYCTVAEFCQLPPEKGPSNDKMQRWFYDPKTEDCKTFTFGGSGGNLNNFKTRRDCRLTCLTIGSP